VNKRPVACNQCPLSACSFGFTPDKEPPSPLVYLIRRQPTKEEISSGEVVMKDYWNDLVGALDKDRIGYASMIRCSFDMRKIPVSLIKAINICRVHDNGIEKFNPNSFIITYDINDAFKIPAYKAFIKRAFELALTYVNEGYRPAILMGHEVSKAINPHLFADTGNERGTTFKDWVGHHWIGEWPFETKREKFERNLR